MGISVLIIGKSGSGKSTSLRNFNKDEIGIINVLSKPLPFKNDLPTIDTDDYDNVKKVLERSKVNSIVIDDAGYLITNNFMRKHSNIGGGNAVYNFYNDMADQFWNLIEFTQKLPKEKITYFFMHEDKNDFGDIKPKTIGKILDDKVCVEGMFTIVLRAKKVDKNYYFFTQATDGDVAKTPMGMFNDLYIDNDLKLVDKTIREYYNIKEEN